MECITGLPADSISLDSVNIYWGASTGVFTVPRSRDGTTMPSLLTNINISSIVTIDPGQQLLPGIAHISRIIHHSLDWYH